jgi:hypothetical protein
VNCVVSEKPSAGSNARPPPNGGVLIVTVVDALASPTIGP